MRLKRSSSQAEVRLSAHPAPGIRAVVAVGVTVGARSYLQRGSRASVRSECTVRANITGHMAVLRLLAAQRGCNVKRALRNISASHSGDIWPNPPCTHL